MPYADPEKRRACHREYEARRRAVDPERCRERVRRYRITHPENYFMGGARKRAKQYGVPCTLTLADVRALLAPMRCSTTGLPLTRNTGGGHSDALSPSIDRIEPARGYVPGNVRLVCHRFNMLRGTDPVSHDYRHALRVLAETTHADDSAITRNPYQ